MEHRGQQQRYSARGNGRRRSRPSHSPNRDLCSLVATLSNKWHRLDHTDPDGLITAGVLEHGEHANIDVLLGIVLDDLPC